MADGRVAILSSKGDLTSFSCGNTSIRFRTSPRLIKYLRVKEWDEGYLVVDARYESGDEEEYIDLLPILDDLYIDPQAFVRPIKEVRVDYPADN